MTSEALAAGRVSKRLIKQNKKVLKLNLKTDRQSLIKTICGSSLRWPYHFVKQATQTTETKYDLKSRLTRDNNINGVIDATKEINRQL